MGNQTKDKFGKIKKLWNFTKVKKFLFILIGLLLIIVILSIFITAFLNTKDIVSEPDPIIQAGFSPPPYRPPLPSPSNTETENTDLFETESTGSAQ